MANCGRYLPAALEALTPYCSLVISPVVSHIVDIIISKAPMVWVFWWREGEDPIHLPLRLLSIPGECQPNQDRTPKTSTAYHYQCEGIICIFQTALQLRRKNFSRISAGTQLCKCCCETFEDSITCRLLRTSSHCASPLSRSGILTMPVSSEPRIQACVGEQRGCISVLPALPIPNLSAITWDSRVERLIKNNY